jgi:ABC-type sugar transport system permease subunit
MTTLTSTTQSPPAARTLSAWQRWRFRHRQPLEAWIILTPVLLYFFVFNVAPVLLNLSLSFTRWNGITGFPEWIGLNNYLQYTRGVYPTIIFNTALFAVSALLIQTTVAFLIAVLLNQKVIGRSLHRALWYVPTLTSAAIMAQVAVIFISPFDGVLNAILAGLGQKPVIWTVEGNWMRAFIVAFTIWRGIGSPVVLFLAALQGIHPELYEAAMVDGANGWNLLRRITIPLLRPMILFVFVTGIIGGFQIFEAVLLISKGGPQNMTNVMLLQIYNGAVIMAILLLWFSLTGMRLMQQGQGEEGA